MTNILVVEDNFYHSKQIINYVSQSINNVKIYGITYSGTEALEMMKKQEIDIVILDLKLKDMNGVNLIGQLEYLQLNKYINSIIVISANTSLIEKIYKSKYVYKYFIKPYDFFDFKKSIQEIILNNNLKFDEDIIKVKINQELEKLHFNFTYKGTIYLRECIYQMYNLHEFDVTNLSKKIYPIVARKYNQSINTIYGNIKQSINTMFFDCDEASLRKYFKYSFITKPKPREIIYEILSRLHNKF